MRGEGRRGPWTRRTESMAGLSIGGAGQAVAAPGAADAAQHRRAAARPSADPAELHPAQGRPPADRAAGSAHRRRHPRQRNLCRPLRVRRQGGDQRRPLAVRDRAAVGGMGGERCSASAGCAICAPPNPASPAPMPAPWSTNGSRVQGAWHPIAWQPEIAGAPHHRLAQPGAADPARRRRAVLSPLPAQPGAPGPLSAPYRDRGARRRAADAGADRARPMRRCAWPGRRGTCATAIKQLVAEIERQILPDGGHISRNPGALIELLLDFLPLRQAFHGPQPRAAARSSTTPSTA